MTEQHPPNEPLFSDTRNASKFLIPKAKRWSFIITFIVATLIGELLAAWLIVTISPLLPPPIPAASASGNSPDLLNSFLGGYFLSSLTGLIQGLLHGAILGTAQWLILRQYLSRSAVWILLTAVGNGIFSILGVLWLRNSTSLVQIIPVYFEFICAIWLGLAQWICLRHFVKQSSWWIVVYSIASLVSFLGKKLLWLLTDWLSRLGTDFLVLSMLSMISPHLSVLLFWGVVPALVLCLYQRRGY